MKLGVCYYPELWTEDQWLDDAQKMQKLGLSIVRIGEFSWYKLEPSSGNYHWDWLDTILEVMAKSGLEVVLSTPTAVPPAWLLHQNPEILSINKNGLRNKIGGQGSFCYHHPLLLESAGSIVSAMVDRYWEDTNIKGWQIDNRLGSPSGMDCYCEICLNTFRNWLQIRYGELITLNSIWGTTVSGQYYSEWDEIDFPRDDFSKTNPAMLLDYQRFRSNSLVNFQNMQIEIIKSKSINLFVTHNISFQNQNIDNFQLGRKLDWISFNSFPTAHAEINVI